MEPSPPSPMTMPRELAARSPSGKTPAKSIVQRESSPSVPASTPLSSPTRSSSKPSLSASNSARRRSGIPAPSPSRLRSSTPVRSLSASVGTTSATPPGLPSSTMATPPSNPLSKRQSTSSPRKRPSPSFRTATPPTGKNNKKTTKPNLTVQTSPAQNAPSKPQTPQSTGNSSRHALSSLSSATTSSPNLLATVSSVTPLQSPATLSTPNSTRRSFTPSRRGEHVRTPRSSESSRIPTVSPGRSATRLMVDTDQTNIPLTPRLSQKHGSSRTSSPANSFRTSPRNSVRSIDQKASSPSKGYARPKPIVIGSSNAKASGSPTKALSTPPNNTTPDNKGSLSQKDGHVPASPMMRDIQQKGRDLLDSWQQLQHETESALESATQKLYASQNPMAMYPNMDSSIETGEDDMLLFSKQSGEYPLEDESPVRSVVGSYPTGQTEAPIVTSKNTGSSSDHSTEDGEIEAAIAAAPSADIVPPPRTLTPQSHEDTHALVILTATTSESEQEYGQPTSQEKAVSAPYPLNVTESIVTKDAVLESIPATTVAPAFQKATPSELSEKADDGFGELEFFDPQTSKSFPPFVDDSIAPIPVVEYTHPGSGAFPTFEFEEGPSHDFLEEKKTDDSSPLWMGSRPAEDDADEQPLMSKEGTDKKEQPLSPMSDDGYIMHNQRGVVVLPPTKSSPPRASPRVSTRGSPRSSQRGSPRSTPRGKSSTKPAEDSMNAQPSQQNAAYESMAMPPPNQKAACCVIL